MPGFHEFFQSINILLVVLLVFAGIGLWTTARFVRDVVVRGLRRRRDDLPHYVRAGRGPTAGDDELVLALRRIEHLEDQLEFTDGLFHT